MYFNMGNVIINLENIRTVRMKKQLLFINYIGVIDPIIINYDNQNNCMAWYDVLLKKLIFGVDNEI